MTRFAVRSAALAVGLLVLTLLGHPKAVAEPPCGDGSTPKAVACNAPPGAGGDRNLLDYSKYCNSIDVVLDPKGAAVKCSSSTQYRRSVPAIECNPPGTGVSVSECGDCYVYYFDCYLWIWQVACTDVCYRLRDCVWTWDDDPQLKAMGFGVCITSDEESQYLTPIKGNICLFDIINMCGPF